MAPTITIRPAPGTWVIRAGGAVLGQTKAALELTEGSLPPVIYFPRADIAMAFLDKTDKSTSCQWKGEASYYSIQTKSTVLDNVAWSYEAPREVAAQIAGHLAFRADQVAVEQI